MADTPPPPAAQSADGRTLTERLRALWDEAYAKVTDPKSREIDPEAFSKATEDARQKVHAFLSYVPEPGIRDQLADSYDLGLDTLGSLTSRDKMAAQLESVGNGIQQTATGFNEGLGSTVGRALDVVPYFVDRAMGGQGVHPVEGTFRKYFVDPAGPPTTPKQRILRAGGNASRTMWSVRYIPRRCR
jgi:hypothetical protein